MSHYRTITHDKYNRDRIPGDGTSLSLVPHRVTSSISPRLGVHDGNIARPAKTAHSTRQHQLVTVLPSPRGISRHLWSTIQTRPRLELPYGPAEGIKTWTITRTGPHSRGSFGERVPDKLWACHLVTLTFYAVPTAGMQRLIGTQQQLSPRPVLVLRFPPAVRPVTRPPALSPSPAPPSHVSSPPKTLCVTDTMGPDPAPSRAIRQEISIKAGHRHLIHPACRVPAGLWAGPLGSPTTCSVERLPLLPGTL